MDSELVLEPGFIAGLAPRRPDAPVLFLDRDGVINVNHGYVHTADRTEWVPGLPVLLEQARVKGFDVIIATNQAGIGRGYYTVEAFAAYMEWVHARMAEANCLVLGTFFCPHHPTAGVGGFRRECTCRKPAPGMFLAAAQRFGINTAEATLVGDKASDMAAGLAAYVGRLVLVGDEPEGAVMPGVLRCRNPGEVPL